MNDYDNDDDGAMIAVIGSLSSFSKRRRYPTTSSSIMIARDGGAASASAAIIKPIVRNKTSHHRQHEEEEACCRRLTTSLQTTTKSPTRTSNSRRTRTIRCRLFLLRQQRLLVLPLFLFLLLLLFSTMILVDAAAKSPTTITTSTKHSRSRRRQSLGRQSPPQPSSKNNSASAAWWTGLKSGLASAASAGCVKTLLQPIDAIKTVQQYHQSTAASGGASAAGLSIKAACQHLLQSSRNQNKWPLSNFYAGLGVTVFGSMPGVALYFGVYSYCKRRLSTTSMATTAGGRQQTTTTTTTAVIALSAAIGNTVASFSRVPYEVIKQKLQTGLYASTWDVFREMAGSPRMALELMFPKGGVYVQMLRDVPYAVVTLLMYETLRSHRRRQQAMMMMNSGGGGKKKDKNNKNNKKMKTKKRGVDIGDFLLGGIAGGIGSWVTNPMDVLKTRLQTDIGTKLYGGSIWTCTKSVWNEGGPQAFLRGSVPRLMHKVPANAFFFLFYEFFKRVLHVVDDDEGSS